MIKQCPLCLGKKVAYDQCSKCDGNGELYKNGNLVTCSTCKGSGLTQQRCPKCYGLGVIDTERDQGVKAARESLMLALDKRW